MMSAEHRETRTPEDPAHKHSDWEQDWQKHRDRNRDLRTRRPFWRSIWRGLRLSCPGCGKEALIRGYLKPVPVCPRCGEIFAHIRTDDFAPWLTILFLGHILLPSVIAVEKLLAPPLWVHFLVWLPTGAEMVRTALPRAKGVALGIMWSLDLRGDEHQH